MALINTITILATVDTSGMVKGLKKGAATINKFGDEVKGIGSQLAGIGAVLAGGGAAAGLVAFAKSGMDAINDLRVEAEKLGTSVESFSKLSYAAKLADVDQETLAGSMEKLNKNLAEAAATAKGPAADALKRLGLSADELTKGDITDATNQVIVALSEVKNPAERARDAMALFGKSGQAMINLAAQGADGLRELQEEATKFGAAITDIDAARIDEADDAITRVQTAIGGLGKSLAIELAPYITAAAESFTAWGKDGVGAANLVKEAFLGVQKAIGFVLDAMDALNVAFKNSQSYTTDWAGSLVGGFASVARTLDGWLAKLGVAKAQGPSFLDFLDTWAEDLHRLSQTQTDVIKQSLVGPTMRQQMDQAIANIQADAGKRAAEAAEKMKAFRGPGAGILGPGETKAAAIKPADLAANKALVAGSTEFANFVLRSRFGAGGGDATREIAANTKTQNVLTQDQNKLLTQLVNQLNLGQALNVLTSI